MYNIVEQNLNGQFFTKIDEMSQKISYNTHVQIYRKSVKLPLTVYEDLRMTSSLTERIILTVPEMLFTSKKDWAGKMPMDSYLMEPCVKEILDCK